ncbi:glycosyltransferase family 4 protein [Candidatus Chloroploca sp. Khr17]|uniref:glycosyltransferase family 4 protein n=1 Tax=Candidatus Chloroploca sp. Khr17 TaxID=2496869 RepID=UPI00101DFBAF|nr:glycosyltransferase family 4 protein [Candidatus Chloroploca sp. Khr17]
MKILFVTPYFPYPSVAHAGGVYTFRMIQGLAEHGHAVTLLSLVTEEEARHLAPMKAICSRVVTIPTDPHWRHAVQYLPRHLLAPATFPGWHPKLAAVLQNLVAQETFDVVQLNWSELGQYVGLLKQKSATVLCAIDVLSTTLERDWANEKDFVRKLWLSWYAKDAKRYEKKIYPQIDHIITLSQKDHDYLMNHIRQVQASVLLPGVDETLLQLPLQLHESKDIVFVGHMQRPFNVSAVLWFYHQVFPYVRQQVPAARLVVVGADPPDTIRSLAKDPGVVVTGAVERIEDFYASSRLAIVPLFVGGGIIKKAIDALAAGCPIVTTRIGVEGLAVRDEQEVLLADDATAFGHAVVRLLQDDTLWMHLARAGRACVLRQHHWPSTIAALEAIYQKVCDRA